MATKKLYWAEGSEKDYEGLKGAFLNHGVVVPEDMKLWLEGYIYFGTEGGEVMCVSDTTVYQGMLVVIKAAGLRLFPEEHFEPFDKVIYRDDDMKTWFIDFYCGIEGETIRAASKEMHHYEPWMAKYIGSNLDYEDWQRPSED